MTPHELREWRVSHLYTAAELAAVLETTETTINRWERGEARIPGMLAYALKGLSFTHSNAGNGTCRCTHPRCRYWPDRYAANGRSYDPH